MIQLEFFQLKSKIQRSYGRKSLFSILPTAVAKFISSRKISDYWRFFQLTTKTLKIVKQNKKTAKKLETLSSLPELCLRKHSIRLVFIIVPQIHLLLLVSVYFSQPFLISIQTTLDNNV